MKRRLSEVDRMMIALCVGIVVGFGVTLLLLVLAA